MKSLCSPLLATSVLVTILLVVESASIHAQTSERAVPPPPQPQRSVPDGFTFAAGGDLIGPYSSFSVDTTPGIPPIAELFRSADLGFANQEGAIFDQATFRGSPAAENGGGTPIYSFDVAKDLKAMGVTIVSKANNHATDWGTQGLEATLASLKAAHIVQAGGGLVCKVQADWLEIGWPGVRVSCGFVRVDGKEHEASFEARCTHGG